MNAYKFIDIYGIDKAERVISNLSFDYEWYSEKTGSYYSSQKNDAVNIKKLKRAINDYEEMHRTLSKYKALVVEWSNNSIKG